LSEYDFTTGTKILVIATLVQLGGLVLSLLYEETGTFALFLGGGLFCSIVAVYAAATDRTMSVSSRGGPFGKRSVHETSAANMFSIFSMMLIAFPVIILLIASSSDPNEVFAVILALIGGVIVLLGGFAAGKEWDGDSLGESFSDIKEGMERRRFKRRHRR